MFLRFDCITNMKEKKMSNLSEEIINRYLTGQCSEEELIEVGGGQRGVDLFFQGDIINVGRSIGSYFRSFKPDIGNFKHYTLLGYERCVYETALELFYRRLGLCHIALFLTFRRRGLLIFD